MTTIIATDKFVTVDRLVGQSLLHGMRFKEGDKFRKSDDGTFTVIASGALPDDQQMYALQRFIIPMIKKLDSLFHQCFTSNINEVVRQIINLDDRTDAELTAEIDLADGLHQRIYHRDKERLTMVTSLGVFNIEAELPLLKEGEELLTTRKKFNVTDTGAGEISVMGSGADFALMAYTLHDDPVDYDGMASVYKVISDCDQLTSSKFNMIKVEDHKPLVKEMI